MANFFQGSNMRDNKHQRRKALMLVVRAISILAVGAGAVLAVNFITGQIAINRELNFATQGNSPSVVRSGQPTALNIGSLKINAPVVPVGLAPDHSLQIPAKDNEIGWYSLGASPGEAGPAVLVGHLDSATGPAIFWHLKDIKPADEVIISKSNNTKAVFKVDSIENVPQDNFPTGKVYGATGYPALRLLTCSGTYSKSLHRYSQNLVVYAHLDRIEK